MTPGSDDDSLPDVRHARWTLSRRQVVGLGIGSAVATMLASACSSSAKQGSGSVTTQGEDFSVRFSDFVVADEPNADPSTVEWPSFVTDAGGDVQSLYEFQLTHGELMRYMPCFCGCGQNAGHFNNRDCYVQSVSADGNVVFDSMAPT